MLFSGWFSERFAREQSLSGPQTYIRQFLDPEAAAEDAEAMADAEFDRIAKAFGAEVVELPQEG